VYTILIQHKHSTSDNLTSVWIAELVEMSKSLTFLVYCYEDTKRFVLALF